VNFENAYEKFLAGTATPEEVEFVRSEMKKASAVNDILEKVKKEGATHEADEGKVKAAIKKYNFKTTIKIIAIVCAALLVLTIGVACAIGIPVINNAKANLNYTEEQAEQIAMEYVREKFPDRADGLSALHVGKDLEVMGRVKNARYIYTVYLGSDSFRDVEIEVDAKSGTVVDLDWD